MIATSDIWTVIAVLGLGTFLIRFSFLGIIGDRPLPTWVLRLLRCTPVAVLPGLVAPLVVWPTATQGQFDPLRFVVAVIVLGVGIKTRKVVPAILAGAVMLTLGIALQL